MRNTLGPLFAILTLVFTHRAEAEDEFWLNEIMAVSTGDDSAEYEVELVVSTESEGSVNIQLEPYHPSNSYSFIRGMIKQKAEGPWHGLHVTTEKTNFGYFPLNGATASGLRVKYGNRSRLYCWGKGVTTGTELNGVKCESIITDDARGLNTGKGTNIAYALYNKNGTPTGGGGKESDFEWLESKDDDNATFGSTWKVNECPSTSTCTGITNQEIAGGGSEPSPPTLPLRPDSSTPFWLNEIATATPASAGASVQCEVEIVSSPENGGEIHVIPYNPNTNAVHMVSLQQQPESGPWNGFHVATVKISAGYFPTNGDPSGVLVKLGDIGRMYCWGKDVTVGHTLGKFRCQSIITADERGLNAGAGRKMAYALYNKEDKPSGGSNESDFQWLESKTSADTPFTTIGEVNACLAPNGETCPGIVDQVIVSSGDGGGEGGDGSGDGDGDGNGGDSDSGGSGWRPTLSCFASVLTVLALSC